MYTCVSCVYVCVHVHWLLLFPTTQEVGPGSAIEACSASGAGAESRRSHRRALWCHRRRPATPGGALPLGGHSHIRTRVLFS